MMRDERGQILPLVAVASLLIIAFSYSILFFELAQADRARDQGVADILALSAALSLAKDRNFTGESLALSRARNEVLDAAYRHAANETKESTGTGSEYFRMPLEWERNTSGAISKLERETGRRSSVADGRARGFVAAIARRYYRDRSYRLAVAGAADGVAGSAILEELRSRLASYETRKTIIKERLVAAATAYGAAKTSGASDTGKRFAEFKLFRSSLGGLTAARNKVARRLTAMERSVGSPSHRGEDETAVMIVVKRRGEQHLPAFVGGQRLMLLPALAAAGLRPLPQRGVSGEPAGTQADIHGLLGPEAESWFADAVLLTRGLRPADSEMAKLLPYFIANTKAAVKNYTPVLVSAASVQRFLGADFVERFNAPEK